MNYIFEKNNVPELIEMLVPGDTVTISYEDIKELLNTKASPGRKPIEVNGDLFDKVVNDWQAGIITAREAMRQLNLKPNTFYRRIKDRNKEIKEEISQARQTVHGDIAEIRKDLHDLGKQIYSDAKEMRQDVDEKLQLMDMSRDIRMEKLNAEITHREEMDELRQTVYEESRQQKDSN